MLTKKFIPHKEIKERIPQIDKLERLFQFFRVKGACRSLSSLILPQERFCLLLGIFVISTLVVGIWEDFEAIVILFCGFRCVILKISEKD
jgi:hypothetical protein